MKETILHKEIKNLKTLLTNTLNTEENKTFIKLLYNLNENKLFIKVNKLDLKISLNLQTNLEKSLEEELKNKLINNTKVVSNFSLYPLILLFNNFLREKSHSIFVTESEFNKWNENNKLIKKVLKGKSGKEYFLECENEINE
ncbi:hypothetical protein TUBRATIS_28470 [Tubulinosema ratisbonensis]|uniref:Uncharacterized protein n=1 Tax=Tubulinosema ratisbonensis TaxID=291195 RepID=A0A437AHS7_9MICR|nr:hypothetical protein TUBRATIS_28470 [Tubulinosema ratisbonensis]